MSLEVGYVKEIDRVITSKEVIQFSEISGDHNPIHLDSEYAKNTIFKQRIVHGMHSVSFISGLLSGIFNDFDSIYVSQSIKFIRPIYLDEVIKIKVILKKIIQSKSLYIFDTFCEVNGDIAVKGQAEILCLSKKNAGL
jgi:3-hydroxybutyryl-CoA dehydratase